MAGVVALDELHKRVPCNMLYEVVLKIIIRCLKAAQDW